MIDKSEMPWAYKGTDPHEPRFVKPSHHDCLVIPSHHDCQCNPANVASEGFVQRAISDHNHALGSHNEQFRRVYDRIEQVRKMQVVPEAIEIMDEFGKIKSRINADLTAIVDGREKRILTSDDDRRYGERFYLHNKQLEELEDKLNNLAEGGTIEPVKTFTFDESDFSVSDDKFVTLKTGEVASDDANVVTGGSVYSAIENKGAEITAETDTKIGTQYQTITSETDDKISSQYQTITSETDDKFSSQYQIITSETDDNLSSQYHTITAETDYKINTTASQLRDDISTSISTFKNDVDTQIDELAKNIRSHYKYIQNEVENNTYIKLLDNYNNTVSLDGDISFKRYDFTYGGRYSGFFYYTRNSVGIDGVTIMPHFDSSSILTKFNKSVYIQNPNPYLPFQNDISNGGSGNIAIVLPIDDGTQFLSIETDFPATANAEVLYSKSESGEYTAVIKIADGDNVRYYTVSNEGILTELPEPPADTNFVSTTASVQVDNNCYVHFDFATGKVTFEDTGIMHPMVTLAPIELSNTVIVPNMLEYGDMREFVLALRMKNCMLPLSFSSFDNETIRLIDRFNIFTTENLINLSSDEYTYIRIMEVSPSVFLVEPIGGLINVTSANS